MSQRPIIDAGPSLNFLSINKERLLIGMLGPLSVPETVEAEVDDKPPVACQLAVTITPHDVLHRIDLASPTVSRVDPG